MTVLAMVFDHAGVMPNPARDRLRVRLPRKERAELAPPTAEYVQAVSALLVPAYSHTLVSEDELDYAALLS